MVTPEGVTFGTGAVAAAVKDTTSAAQAAAGGAANAAEKTVTGALGAGDAGNLLRQDNQSTTGGGGDDASNKSGMPKKITTKEATQMAESLGFRKTSYTSNGQRGFQKGNKYITIDVDSHNGGTWKMADSIRNLGSKRTRMGTYDQFLNRIGD